jgi:hypothetical protein
MNIDNLISSFDFEKFKQDCILHNILKIYINKKSQLSSCDYNAAIMLRNQLADFSDILKRLLKYAKCFPSMCENCEGLKKCIDCTIKDNCVDASIELYKLKQQTAVT